MPLRYRYLLLLPFVLASACAQVGGNDASVTPSEASLQRFDPEAAFQPSENVMADLDATLARAAGRDRLALVVMGANWCHDSREFVKSLNEPVLKELVSAKYEILFVDVGYLESGREVINRFGMPVIYGTPTVLVVEPGTDLLVNRQDLHRWRDAATIDVDEAVEYFSRMAAPAARQAAAQVWAAKPVVLETLYDEIDAFERLQAERIYRGFAVLGPMLAMEKKDRPEEFERYWGQVRDLRYQITEDLEALRAHARDQAAAGETDVVLEYPDYRPFDWE